MITHAYFPDHPNPLVRELDNYEITDFPFTNNKFICKLPKYFLLEG